MQKRTAKKAMGTLGLLAAMVAGSLLLMRTSSNGRLCERWGGKWASTTAVCYSRSCYADGDCGAWASPSTRCERLSVGAPIADVYFELGNAERVEGSRHSWHANKMGPEQIVAVIENGRLVSLDCPTCCSGREAERLGDAP